MRAFQLVGWRQPPELCEVPVPEPGPGQVRVKVGGAGACHSDLHIMEAPGPPPGLTTGLPFTLGHENAGLGGTAGPGRHRVHTRGACDCLRLAGLRGVCQLPPGPGELLPDARGAGSGPGRWSRRRNGHVPARPGVAVPDSARHPRPRQAAPPSDAGLTSYHAVKRSLHLLGPGSAVVAIGAGGLGQMTIQILRAHHGDHRRRRGHRRRQAGIRHAHGSRRSVSLGRRGDQAHQGSDG